VTCAPEHFFTGGNKMNTATTATSRQIAGEDQAVSLTEAEKVVDLTVDNETSTQVKGGILIGLLLPAVQK
jgi:hypothetical protein